MPLNNKPTPLAVGTPAPDFELPNHEGQAVSLQSLRGQKVALYFYPKDDTEDCTTQACNLRDHYQAVQEAGVRLFGISPNDAKSHNKFIAKHSLPFPLLVDAGREVAAAYGLRIEKNMYGKVVFSTARVTYLIDEVGVISHVIANVDVSQHSAQIVSCLQC